MWSYLWQNFLRDKKYIDFTLDRIKSYINKYWFTTLFEIGPWKAALTKNLVELFSNIYLFEKDETFKEILDWVIWSKWKIIWWDVLEQDINNIVSNNNLDIVDIMIVWNIPYYITSPIFRKFFENNYGFRYGIFMIQKEVWEKIKRDSDKKSYLWWLLNYRYDVKYLKTVPAKAFSPAPKVDSCLVELVIKKEIPNINYDLLVDLLNNISMYKRKTLGKIWKMCKDKNNKFSYNLPENLSKMRLEDISWKDMESILA